MSPRKGWKGRTGGETWTRRGDRKASLLVLTLKVFQFLFPQRQQRRRKKKQHKKGCGGGVILVPRRRRRRRLPAATPFIIACFRLWNAIPLAQHCEARLHLPISGGASSTSSFPPPPRLPLNTWSHVPRKDRNGNFCREG